MFKRLADVQSIFIVGLFGLVSLGLTIKWQVPTTAAALPTTSPWLTYPSVEPYPDSRRNPEEWEIITLEGFEGGALPPNWSAVDLGGDANERFWGVDDYLHYTGNYAIWPARGGAQGYDPLINNNYANNMHTRLSYGPFSLSNSDWVNVKFQLWREVYDSNDYLVLEVSPNGQSGFVELARWNYSYAAWPPYPISESFDNFAGDDSVWLSWRFYSNSSGTRRGMWLDDVDLAKQLVVTATPTRTPTAPPPPSLTPTPRPQNIKVYLPVMGLRYPQMKVKSGLHLGNRPNLDWNVPSDMLFRLHGGVDGALPKVVVVLSNQVFTITRQTSGNCNITGVQVRDPVAFNFLNEVAAKGGMVVVRIYPSPGNFSDWANPGGSHTLLMGADPPPGQTYCWDPVPGDGLWTAADYYRSLDDVADEMKAIYDFVISTQGWPAERLYFVPANEPNVEWYARFGDVVYPAVYTPESWLAMDVYFSSLYDRAKTLNPNIQVLTPSMAQGAYAELKGFGSCEDLPIAGGGGGYDQMHTTYEIKNDGWAWNNYWRDGVEWWQDLWCTDGNNIVSDQVFQYFPSWLQTRILTDTRPAFITEADLLSPCQGPDNPTLRNKDTNSAGAQQSVWRFVEQARGADYIAVWAVSIQGADSPLPNSGQDHGNCADPNNEQAWHEGYRDVPYLGGYERDWVRLWWLRPEAP